MLFEGWGLYHGNRGRDAPDGWAWRSHPFHPGNNANGINGDPDGDDCAPNDGAIGHDALDDQIRLESTPGHTPDHVAIAIGEGAASAVMCGDLMHSPVQCLHPEWVPWPDWDAELASRTRRAFLERYCDTDTLCCTAHFPSPSVGRIRRKGNGFSCEAA